MIRPKCLMCKKELTEFGGLIITPPCQKPELKEYHKKYHICIKCFPLIIRAICIGKIR
jgi:hypothetical protein